MMECWNIGEAIVLLTIPFLLFCLNSVASVPLTFDF